MFKFLRKKLKKFEDKLEAELQVELEKETEGVEPKEPVEKPELETIDEEKIVVEEPKDKIAEPKPKELVDSNIKKLVKKPKRSEELIRRIRTYFEDTEKH